MPGLVHTRSHKFSVAFIISRIRTLCTTILNLVGLYGLYGPYGLYGLYAKVELQQGFRLKMYGKPLTMPQYDKAFPLDKQPGSYVVKHWNDDADTVMIDCAFP